MLYIKPLNLEDYKEEFLAIKNIPESENGFLNHYKNSSLNEFKNEIIPKLIKYSKGENLPDDYVPCTYYFLWEDNKIVGLYKVRHFLNEDLRNGEGHIGYCILKEYRRKNFATSGLALIIDECKNLVKESELYFSVNKNNTASLKVQLKNGAYITHEDESKYYTRIKLK